MKKCNENIALPKYQSYQAKYKHSKKELEQIESLQHFMNEYSKL